MGETERLAEYIVNARYEDLPADVVAHAKKTIMDTLSCGLGGRKSLEGDMLVDIVREMGGKPEATIIGEKTKVSCLQAAQVNRVITNILDYDDTYTKYMTGHVSTVLVPVALAIGEHVNASGKDVINALVLGYEVVIRLREAINPTEKAMGTFEGVDTGYAFGVVTIAGKLLGLNAAQMADAFGLTGYIRTWRVPHANPDPKEGMARWMKVTGGDFTFLAINSAFLAKRGMAGNRVILDQDRGYERSVGSDRYDAGKLIAGLGKEYRMTGIGFKFYSACRGTSATLDAVAAIAAENNLNIDDVEQVVIRVLDVKSPMIFGFYEPVHKIQAEFSIPYTATMILMREPTGPNWYTEDKLNDPQIRQFQRRIKYVEDPTGPNKPGSGGIHKVEITTKDGRTFSKPVGTPKGEPDEIPFTRQEHVDKLFNMAAWLGMKQSRINELLEAFDRLDELESISQLTRLLVCE